MPGFSQNLPTRPRRLMTFSRDRLRYSSGPGIYFHLFGVIFSASGLFVLAACVWFVLSLVGIVPADDNTNQPTIGENFLVILGLLAIGGGHFLCGSILLWTHRSTLDRAHDLVAVRSGWLGCRRQKRRLSEFCEVTILPGKSVFGARSESWFDVALRDPQGVSVVLGKVSRSWDLARVVAGEVAEFTELPVVWS